MWAAAASASAAAGAAAAVSALILDRRLSGATDGYWQSQLVVKIIYTYLKS